MGLCKTHPGGVRARAGTRGEGRGEGLGVRAPGRAGAGAPGLELPRFGAKGDGKMARKAKVVDQTARAAAPATGVVPGAGVAGVAGLGANLLTTALTGGAPVVAAQAPGKGGKKPQVTVGMTAKDKDGKDVLVVDMYLEALRAKKDAESRMTACFGELAPELERERVAQSRRGSTYHESLAVNGKLTYTIPNRYCKIAADEAGTLDEKVTRLTAIFGADVGRFVRRATSYEFDVEQLMADQAFGATLFAAIREVCLKARKDPTTIIKTEEVLVPTEELTRERVMKADVEARFAQAQAQALVVPVKATLKEGGKP